MEGPYWREFDRCMRARDAKGAKVAYQRWINSDEPSFADRAHEKANVLLARGERDAALGELTSAIDAGQDPRLLCRLKRADIFLQAGLRQAALDDFNALLARASGTTSPAFRIVARRWRAYILALRGSPDFETAYADCIPGEIGDIDGRLVQTSDLPAICEKARGGTSVGGRCDRASDDER